MYPFPSRLPIIVQARSLEQAQPGTHARLLGHSDLIWEGYLTPTPLNQTYKVRIRYQLGHYPEVTVKEPKLHSPTGLPIPHLYGQKTLCLFNPHKMEWNSRMKLSDSTLPWTSVWLYYYELWLATGEWLGGGDHPNPPKQNRIAEN